MINENHEIERRFIELEEKLKEYKMTYDHNYLYFRTEVGVLKGKVEALEYEIIRIRDKKDNAD